VKIRGGDQPVPSSQCRLDVGRAGASDPAQTHLGDHVDERRIAEPAYRARLIVPHTVQILAEVEMGVERCRTCSRSCARESNRDDRRDRVIAADDQRYGTTCDDRLYSAGRTPFVPSQIARIAADVASINEPDAVR
jgi:hypothetical protein